MLDETSVAYPAERECVRVAEPPVELCEPNRLYPLLECPPMREGAVALIGRNADGLPKVLTIVRAPHVEPSLNLALIRRKGAILGATEVRVLQ